jgi:hypothetical protein
MRCELAAVAGFLVGAASLAGGETQAAENAASIYLLGTKGSMAGFTPPPGTYFVDVNTLLLCRCAKIMLDIRTSQTGHGSTYDEKIHRPYLLSGISTRPRLL